MEGIQTMRITIAITLACAALAASPASARERAMLTRVDATTVAVDRGEIVPEGLWISSDPVLDGGDQPVDAAVIRKAGKNGKILLAIPASERRYVLLKDAAGQISTVAERVIPLEQGSNFRDLGGYVTNDGRTVRWGKVFRSGAMPMLTEADYALVDQLRIGTVVDLRSLEERETAPDQLDDRNGALFVSNDYSLKPLMANFGKGNGENLYSGMEKFLVPQLRSLYRQIVADDGAVLFHCSAGQDRTGMAAALLYDVLGVDRETIVKDYHMSTALRRPQWEMPQINPADHPNNPILKYYLARDPAKRYVAEPLFTATGQSHLVQFFAYIDENYGSSEGFLKEGLGLRKQDIAKLRDTMLN